MMIAQLEKELAGQEVLVSDIEFDLIPPSRNNEAITVRIDTKTVPVDEVNNVYNTLKSLYPVNSIILMPKQITIEYLNERQITSLQNDLQKLLKNIQEVGQD